MVFITRKGLVVIFALLIIFAVVGIYLHYKLIYLLREKHNEKWKALGCPMLLINNSIKNNIAILSFLKNKEYLKLNDLQLIRISNILWNFSWIYLVFFVITISLFVIHFLKL